MGLFWTKDPNPFFFYRIRVTQKVWIRTHPDPQHCFQLHVLYLERVQDRFSKTCQFSYDRVRLEKIILELHAEECNVLPMGLKFWCLQNLFYDYTSVLHFSR